MSKRGAKIVMACRNLELAEAAAKEVKEVGQGQVSVMKLDLASLESVRAFAQEYNDKEERSQFLIFLNLSNFQFCPTFQFF